MTQRALREHYIKQAFREHSDFIILSEPKLRRLVYKVSTVDGDSLASTSLSTNPFSSHTEDTEGFLSSGDKILIPEHDSL